MSTNLELITAEIANEIANEIGRLHDFFTSWYNGTCEQSTYDTECGNHLSANFLNVQPGGARLNREVFGAAIKGGYGVNPAFKILTRNAEIRAELETGKIWLVTYEEYQKGAKFSPNHNARFSTLLIERRADNDFLWHHIHETWLPEDHHAPHLFEF